MTQAPVTAVPGTVGIIDGFPSKGLRNINPNAERKVLKPPLFRRLSAP